MERKISILFFIFVFSFLFIKSNYSYQNDFILGDTNIGDVNSDGKINSLDYIIIRKYLMNIMTLTNKEKSLADVNSDGKISSLDYILIRKSILEGTKIEGKTNSSTNASSSSESTSTHTATPTPTPTLTPTPKSTENTSVSVSLNTTSATLTYSIAHTFTITSSGNGTIKCSSSDTSVAVCEISGTTLIVTPKAKNADNQKATITVSKGEKNVKLSIVVNRKELKCPGNKISTVTYDGKEHTYAGSNCPTGSSEKVARGTAVGKYNGTCTANAGYKFNNNCNNATLIIAKKDESSITLKNTNVAIEGIGKTITLEATITNGNSSITWSSSNENVAKVSSSGVVTAVGKGKATITAQLSNKATAKAKVTVFEKAIFFGDSITEGFCAYCTQEYNNNSTSYYSWANYINDNYYIASTNMGAGGWTATGYSSNINPYVISHIIEQSTNNKVYDSYFKFTNGMRDGRLNRIRENETNIFKTISYDYVILSGGCNDIGASFMDTTKYPGFNFAASFEHYLDVVINQWPNAKIGYIITYQTPDFESDYLKKNNIKDPICNSYNDRCPDKAYWYYITMINILNKKKIPYYNLYLNEISHNILHTNSSGSNNLLASDKLHLSKKGYETISPYIFNWMMTLKKHSQY